MAARAHSIFLCAHFSTPASPQLVSGPPRGLPMRPGGCLVLQCLGAVRKVLARPGNGRGFLRQRAVRSDQ